MEQHTKFEHQTPFLSFTCIRVPAVNPTASPQDKMNDVFPLYVRADHVIGMHPPFPGGDLGDLRSTHTIMVVAGLGPFIVEGDVDDVLMRVLQAGGNKTVGNVKFSHSHDDGEF